MSVIINGDTGIDKITDGSIVAADIGSGEVTQAKLASGVATTGPAFRVYLSTNQSISGSTWTKVAFDTEAWDTNSDFNTTDNRFQPTVAGYYLISANVRFNDAYYSSLQIYKNGSVYSALPCNMSNRATQTNGGSTLIYFNGSTDYIELYALSLTTGNTLQSGNTWTWMTGFLARAA